MNVRGGRSPRPLVLVASVALVVVATAFAAYAVTVANGRTAALTQHSTGNLVVFQPSDRHLANAVQLRRLGGGPPVEFGGPVGHPLVVNFFASWCTACQRELKALATVAAEGRVAFVGVDTDDPDPALASRLLRRAGARYPVGIGTASLPLTYGTGNLPTTAFIDAKGHIVALALGALTRRQLDHYVTALVAGKPL